MTKVAIENLIRLDRYKQVVFGWLAARRFLNGYEIFSDDSGFGSFGLMKKALDFSYEYALTKSSNNQELLELVEKVKENVPGMDDFGYPLSSTALNVGVMIYETLHIIQGNTEYKSVKDISTAATDNVDMIVQVAESWEYGDENFEQKILSHPLMVEEVDIQNEIIVYLEKIDTVGKRDFLILEEMQNDRLYTKLDLRTTLAE